MKTDKQLETKDGTSPVAVVSTSAFGDSSTLDFVQGLTRWADGIEVAAEGPAWLSLEGAGRSMMRLLARYPGVVTVHAPITDLDLAAEDDPCLRAFAQRCYRHSLQIAADLGAKHVVVHSHLWSRPIRNRKAVQRTALDALCRLGLDAAELGLKVAVENVGTNGRSLFSADEYVEICCEGLPGLCALLDVGHAHVNGWDIPSVIRRLGPALEALHLHDNHGNNDEHLPIGAGTIPWLDVWAALKMVPGELRLVLEYAAGTGETTLKEHHGLLRALFNGGSPLTHLQDGPVALQAAR